MAEPAPILMEEDEEEMTNVRWKIPPDVMKIIRKHQKLLSLLYKKEITQYDAAFDLIRKRKLPRMIILHD